MKIFISLCVVSIIGLNPLGAMDCKFEKPQSGMISSLFSEPQKDLGELFCKQYHISSDDTETFKECVMEIMKYLSEVKETNKSVEAYVSYCQKNRVRVDFCTGMIVHLKNYCWKMADAVKLLIFTEDHYDITKLMYLTYEKMMITPKDWEKLQVGNLYIQNCLEDLASEGTPPSGKNEMAILEQNIENTKGSSQCYCFEVIGLENIKSRLSFKENLTDELCKTKKDYVWTKRQLSAIAQVNLNSKQAKELGIDQQKIKQFFSVGKPIFEAGWQDDLDDSRHWSFEFLMKNILKDNQFDNESISLTVAGLKAGFTEQEYEQLIGIITKKGEAFKTITCKSLVIRKLMVMRCTTEYSTTNCNYQGYSKKGFINSFTIVQQMIESDTCEKFTTKAEQVYKYYYQSNIDPYDFENNLKKCKESGKTLFVKCVTGKEYKDT